MRDSKQKQSWFICSSFSSHTAGSNWGQDRTGTHSLLGRSSSASQTAFKRKTSVMSSEVCVFLPCWHDSGVPLAPSHQLFESLFGQEEESWEEDGPGSHEAPHGNTLLRSVHVCVCVCGFTLPLPWMWEVRRARVGRSGLGEEPPAATCQRCGDGRGSAGRVSRKQVPSSLFMSFDYLQISVKYEQRFIHRRALISRNVLVICSE